MYIIGGFCFANIVDYQNNLKECKVNSEYVVLQYVENIKKKSHLNIYIEIFESDAINKAREIDIKVRNNEKLGSLFGVVVSLKDVFCYKDHFVSASSGILKNFKSSYNATCVKKLLEQDAIIIGRVNCDEFAMGSSNENSYYGPVKNPLNEKFVPGGSSGGSAASVAAGLCMVSIGSDTGGSVRLPADFCGVYGLKPSYGKISRYGLIAYSSSLDSVGIIANSLEDLKLVLDNISGGDCFDSTCISVSPDIKNINDKSKLSIAYFKDVFCFEGVDNQIKSTYNDVIEVYKKTESIVGIDFPFLDLLIPTYYIISCAEAASNLSRYDGIRYGIVQKKDNISLTNFYKQNRTNGFGYEVKKRIMVGNFVLSSGYKDAYYIKAQKIRKMLIKKLDDIFKQFDAILLPNSPLLPWEIGKKQILNHKQLYLLDVFNVLANLISSPSISFPVKKIDNGLSCGVQLLGNKFCENNLFEIINRYIKYSSNISA